MKKTFYILLCTALPLAAAAQVEKSVEVTKEYAPGIARAEKLPIAPVLSDTTVLRPDIDYAITPTALETRLESRPIRPATVTYWEFNRPRPFYLKLGAGWALNSVADLYISTQNPGTGYLLGYVNHEGHYGDLRNVFGIKANAMRMDNRAGVAAGKYFGRRTLEGEVCYDNRFYRHDGFVAVPGRKAAQTDYDEVGVAVRFGDDFTDLDRFNFNLALRGSLFNDRFDPGVLSHARQTHLGVDGAMARRFGKHTFRLQAMYEHSAGLKSISDYWEDIFSAGIRYGYRGRVWDFEVGADYYYDRIVRMKQRHYIVPAVRVRLDVGRAYAPYLEIGGTLRDNSLRMLSHLNPYLPSGIWCDKSTVEYSARLGLDGGTGTGRFAYRIFVEATLRENQVFWTVARPYDVGDEWRFLPVQAHQTVGSLVGEAEYKPWSRLLLRLRLQGNLYDDDTPLENGASAFEGRFELRYTAKKISFGVQLLAQSERRWTLAGYDSRAGAWVPDGYFRAPFAFDLGADIDWRVSSGCAIFVQARNLADRKLYTYPLYREYGIQLTAGVKLSF